MFLLSLARKSLANRLLATSLTLASIALSVTLLVLESGLLGAAGVLTGVGLVYALLVLLKGFVESTFGLYLPIQAPSRLAVLYLAAVIVASFLLGLIPALKAYRNSLADGLTVRI